MKNMKQRDKPDKMHKTFVWKTIKQCWQILSPIKIEGLSSCTDDRVYDLHVNSPQTDVDSTQS